MKKYPKVKEYGDPENKCMKHSEQVFVTEKLDGTNLRFTHNGKEIIFGTRNTILGSSTTKEKMFQPVIDYILDAVDSEKLQEYGGYVFFGEGMVRHTISYAWSRTPKFLGFDIYDVAKGEFIRWPEVCAIYDDIGLQVVPFIGVIKGEDIADYVIPQSEYRNGVAEGLMFKDYDAQVFTKRRSEEFFEKHKEAFGKSKKYAENDDEAFVSAYVTNHRIEKMIYKLRDDGHDISMVLMKYLPSALWKDIWEEEWGEIIYRQVRLDFKNCRKLVAKRCLAVLRIVIDHEVV